jgi:hypothetical protein
LISHSRLLAAGARKRRGEALLRPPLAARIGQQTGISAAHALGLGFHQRSRRCARPSATASAASCSARACLSGARARLGQPRQVVGALEIRAGRRDARSSACFHQRDWPARLAAVERIDGAQIPARDR